MRLRIEPEEAKRTDRAQTGLDFLVGMSVFLLAIGFVFLFLPTMFDPFVGTGTGNALIADRSAAHLAENALVDPERPGVLNETKTESFFTTCNSSTVDRMLGIQLARVNVTLEHSGNIVYTCGPDRSTTDSVTTSLRTVTNSQNERLRLYLRVW